MKSLRAVLFILMLLTCQIVLAAPAFKGTLLYVPLDNRPVCLAYAVETMEAAGWDVKTPPLEYIANADRGGNPEALYNWLVDNADESLGMVVSSDALIYGSLVDSRTHNIPLEILKQRADRLVELKKEFRNQLVYVFATIMRSPKRSAAPVEPAYYEEWGTKIFRLGELEDKLEAKEIGHREKRELKKLRQNIPQEILADMYTRRENNIKATELLLHGVESGDFDYLLIGRDDTAEFSQAHREARNMEILVNELPKERIRFFAGADQLGLLLLNRAATKLQYDIPLVQIVYAPGKGGATVPTYEDDTIATSARQHVYVAGGVPILNHKRADLVLAVNTPKNGVTLEASSPVNDYLVTGEVEKFTKLVNVMADNGKAVAIADVKYGNGADNALISNLFANRLEYKLAAYAGWNTAGNSLGYALAQGLLGKQYADGKKEELLQIRYLDDWAYQANVRMDVYRNLIWPNHWKNSGFNAEQIALVEDDVSNLMTCVAEPMLGEVVKEYRFTLPWNRMFEVYVEKASAKENVLENK
ncbi:MAG: DUF4127 family protein [Phascolarctobacterium sp.]|nr:DUF4127 family protein [Phascolarctobacterium sp.]